ncbi:MAG TPA: methyltransferase domain-containing protein [Thermoanaerobaculia bacterium]|nr:methyltransferase domain-containing protein [Thermoanaerobaculia bacterium]
MSAWNPEQYQRFQREREQPFHDLLALVEHRPRMRVADLGCGTGELTRELHRHLKANETVGIDNSETMLLKSSAFGDEMLRFERGDIEAFISDRPFDLVFSNAALHWVEDHGALFHRLTSLLSKDGQVAIQMPANEDNPSHTTAAAVAAEEPFASALAGHVRKSPILPLEQYAQLLHHLGYKRQHVRMQIYGHPLPSSRDVVEWVKGSLLTDYQKRMDAGAFAAFLARYTERLLAAIGDVHPYFYTYKRVLIWGSF